MVQRCIKQAGEGKSALPSTTVLFLVQPPDGDRVRNVQILNTRAKTPEDLLRQSEEVNYSLG